MTKLNHLTLIALLTLMFQLSFGQKSLFGTWTVSCPLEKTDAASVKFCGLCPTVQKGNSMDINDFEMTVDKDEIKINIDNKITPVKYIWKEDLETIEFQYKDLKCKFVVLSNSQNNIRILKSAEGNIITLEKK